MSENKNLGHNSKDGIDVLKNISFNLNFKKIGKMITPSELEIKINRRSRSAKLRIAERI